MTLNLISLGLTENSITAEALQAVKSSKKIYIETYTSTFPYPIKNIEKSLNKVVFGFNKNLVGRKVAEREGIATKPQESGKSLKSKVKITQLTREQVESMEFLAQAKKQNISLLVYGDALSATTHISLIQECKKKKIKYKIFHNASIFTAVAETGLQIYKFGKTTTMPDWDEHKSKPSSFTNYIKQNQKIKAHTLLLVDITLTSKQALSQLEQSISLPKKIVVVSNAGTDKQKIYYNKINKLKNKKIKQPFCIIIPSELHFAEKEFLEK